MSKSSKLESKLQALRDAAEEGDGARLAAIKDALKGAKPAPLVALAARLCQAHGLRELESALSRSFFALHKQGLKKDPGCTGRTAIAKALRTLECMTFEVYEAGIVCIQMEPMWGPPEDSATTLRALCGAAIGELNHPDAPLFLSRLLADESHRVRCAAAEAIGNLGDANLLPLLLFGIFNEPGDSEVLSPLLKSAFYIGQEGLIPWLIPLLSPGSDDAKVREVALALGESRFPRAFDALSNALETTRDPETRQLFMTALALLRREDALERLFEIAEDGLTSDALMALQALEVFAFDEAIGDRLREIAQGRGGREFEETVHRVFGPGL